MSQSMPAGSSLIVDARRTVHGPAGVSTRSSARQRRVGVGPASVAQVGQRPAGLGQREDRRGACRCRPSAGSPAARRGTRRRRGAARRRPRSGSGAGVLDAAGASAGAGVCVDGRSTAPPRSRPRSERRRSGATASQIGATLAFASIRRVAGGTGNTAVGVPAAAHTTGKRPRSGSITTRSGRRWPMGGMPPMVKPVSSRASFALARRTSGSPVTAARRARSTRLGPDTRHRIGSSAPRRPARRTRATSRSARARRRRPRRRPPRCASTRRTRGRRGSRPCGRPRRRRAGSRPGYGGSGTAASLHDGAVVGRPAAG